MLLKCQAQGKAEVESSICQREITLLLHKKYKKNYVGTRVIYMGTYKTLMSLMGALVNYLDDDSVFYMLFEKKIFFQRFLFIFGTERDRA